MNNRAKVHSFATDCKLDTAEYEKKLSGATWTGLTYGFSGWTSGLAFITLADSVAALPALTAGSAAALRLGSAAALVGVAAGYRSYGKSKVICFLLNML